MGGRTVSLERKREKEKREPERDGNERLREMTREQAKKKGANKEYTVRPNRKPSLTPPFQEGTRSFSLLIKGGGCGEMPGTLLRNE